MEVGWGGGFYLLFVCLLLSFFSPLLGHNADTPIILELTFWGCGDLDVREYFLFLVLLLLPLWGGVGVGSSLAVSPVSH